MGSQHLSEDEQMDAIHSLREFMTAVGATERPPVVTPWIPVKVRVSTRKKWGVSTHAGFESRGGGRAPLLILADTARGFGITETRFAPEFVKMAWEESERQLTVHGGVTFTLTF